MKKCFKSKISAKLLSSENFSSKGASFYGSLRNDILVAELKRLSLMKYLPCLWMNFCALRSWLIFLDVANFSSETNPDLHSLYIEVDTPHEKMHFQSIPVFLLCAEKKIPSQHFIFQKFCFQTQELPLKQRPKPSHLSYFNTSKRAWRWTPLIIFQGQRSRQWDCKPLWGHPHKLWRSTTGALGKFSCSAYYCQACTV